MCGENLPRLIIKITIIQPRRLQQLKAKNKKFILAVAIGDQKNYFG